MSTIIQIKSWYVTNLNKIIINAKHYISLPIVVYKDREAFVDRDHHLISLPDNYECRKYTSISQYPRRHVP